MTQQGPNRALDAPLRGNSDSLSFRTQSVLNTHPLLQLRVVLVLWSRLLNTLRDTWFHVRFHLISLVIAFLKRRSVPGLVVFNGITKKHPQIFTVLSVFFGSMVPKIGVPHGPPKSSELDHDSIETHSFGDPLYVFHHRTETLAEFNSITPWRFSTNEWRLRHRLLVTKMWHWEVE